MNAERGRLIGLDLGSRRIGVAVSDSGWAVANGVGVITRCGQPDRDRDAVVSMVDEYSAVGVVVGVPVSMSGRAEAAARHALEEVESLRAVLAVPVYTVDERLTTVEAARSLRAGGRSARRQRDVIDQAAAALLLQTWMDRQRATSRAGGTGTRGD